jgi:hypothetical protein
VGDDPYFDPPLPPDITPDPTDGPIPDPIIPPDTVLPGGGDPAPGGPAPGGELDEFGNPVGTEYIDNAGTTVEDLYPEDPGTVDPEAGTVVDPTEAVVTQADLDEGNVAVGPGAEADTGILGEGQGVEAATTDLTPEQQVDAELARILGEDSPLLAQARAQAAMQMNARGLQNTSMAAGEAQRAMVEAAMPMAQQNAQQAFEREMANTENIQEAGMFTADQMNDLRALEAQLGTDVSMFNVEQLNEALRLQAELRSAMEQGNAEAMNDAALQLAELTRDAQEQQADLDYQASAEAAAARNAMNETIMNNIAALNEQYLQNLGQADLAIINKTYELLIAQNTTAAGIYNHMLDAMAAIMSDPKISPSEAAQKIATLQNTLEASMRMLQELNNTGIDNPTFRDQPGPEQYERGTPEHMELHPDQYDEDGNWLPRGERDEDNDGIPNSEDEDYNPGPGNPGPGGPNTGCFEVGTCFRMADGSLKKVEEIKPGDIMEEGGRVAQTIIGDGQQEDWFDVDGVHVTGSHGIKKGDEWMRVVDAGYDEIDKRELYYTVMNENHRMIAKTGQKFTDFQEVSYVETGWDDFVLLKLNGNVDDETMLTAIKGMKKAA